ncbi:serine/threonine-protein kinase [Streptomyces sp. HMX112]|uniref:serine/threonine-protein kinase n=1 Tax=Streptomyces sp. HMX112 TaxID=3390850 RepID=UPI003A801FCC
MPAQPRITLEPGEELAGYRIESFIARGGMAMVYLARDLSLGRRVALKLLAPELTSHANFRARFVRESELAASVEHPNILPIYSAGEADGVLYIAMRYVDGEDLGQLLDRRSEGDGRLTVAEVMSVFTQAAGALDAAHGVGLVHRDVKPGNILLAGADKPVTARHVYLADFGLTKRSASLSGFTTTGHFLGTIAYVSPEQIADRGLDGRADIYSLGCVMFQVLTGEMPFACDDDAATLWAHMSAPRPRVSDYRDDLPEAVDSVLNRAMATDPDERQPSCRAVIEELRRVLRATPPVTGPRTTVSEPRTPPPTAPSRRPTMRQPVPEQGTGAGAGSEAGAGAGAGTKAGAETKAEAGTGAGAETKAEAGTGAEAGTKAEAGTEAEAEAGKRPPPRRPGQPHAPSTPRRRHVLVLLGVLIVLVAGVVTALFTLRSDGSWVHTGDQAAPFRLEHPPNWSYHPATGAAMYADTPDHLVGIFTDGDKEQWRRAGRVVDDSPDKLVGIMLRHTQEQLSLSTSAEAADAIRAIPAFRRAPLGTPVPARVDGVEGWRLDGTLANPNAKDPPGRIAYRYYLLSVPSGTAHLVFFALPERMAAQEDVFARVRETIQLPEN